MKERIEANWPDWEVVQKIGTGGFGAVYEIRRDVFGKTERAALKVITIPQNSEEIEELYNEGYNEGSVTLHYKAYLEDIVKEYSLMLDMKGHTNVVCCDDLRYAKHEDGIGWDLYIKMELLTPLTKVVGQGVDEEETIRLGRDMCNALILCKKQNIVHRDIKPQNIFVSRTGDYKLGDFGVAKVSEKTASGTKIGTFEYMPPEVYSGKPYGVAADLYSLGLVLYWLLNEKRIPFLSPSDKVPSMDEKMQARLRRLSGETLPAPAHGSKELQAIVLKACAFKPEDRYASAADMLKDLLALEISERTVVLPDSEPAVDADEKTVSIFESTELLAKKPATAQPSEEDGEKTVGLFGAAAGYTPAQDATVVLPKQNTPKASAQPSVPFAQTAPSARGGVYTPPAAPPKAPSAPPKASAPVSAPAPAPQKKKKGGVVKTLILWAACIAVLVGAVFLFRYRGVLCPHFGNWKGSDLPGKIEMTCPLCGVRETAQIVAGGGEFVVWVHNDGAVQGAGEKTFFEGVEEWEDIVQLCANQYGVLGLKADGTVVTAGKLDGISEVTEWKDITQIALADDMEFAVGLKSDGTVITAAGPAVNNSMYTETTDGWRNIASVEVFRGGVLGINSNRSALTNLTALPVFDPDMSDWTNLVQVDAGSFAVAGVQSDGTILWKGIREEAYAETAQWYNVESISVGKTHVVAVQSSGRVKACGDNTYGQCDVNGWTDVVTVIVGDDFTIGVTEDGAIVTTSRKFVDFPNRIADITL